MAVPFMVISTAACPTIFVAVRGGPAAAKGSNLRVDMHMVCIYRRR
jgi:hypothetical protein